MADLESVLTPEGSSSQWLQGGRGCMLLFLAVGGLYAAGAELAWRMFGAGDIGLAFFPPAGVTLAALIVLPRRRWPWVIAAIVVAEVVVDRAHGLSFSVAGRYALANTLEPLVGSLVMRWMSGGPSDVRRRRGMVEFLLGGVVAGPLAGGLIGASINSTNLVGWLEAALHWSAGDGVGVLAVGGPVLALRGVAWRTGRWRSVEAIAVTAGIVAVSVLSFWVWAVPPGILVLPALAWTAFRFEVPGVALAGFVMASIANLGTATGRGPFASTDVSSQAQLGLTQLFLATTILVAWFLAIETSERAAAVENSLRETYARQQAESLADLGQLSAALVQVVVPLDVARVVAGFVEDHFGAPFALVNLLDPVTNRFRPSALHEPPPAIAAEVSRWNIDAATPGPHAMRIGEPVWIASHDELVARYPAMRSLAAVQQLHSLGALPLVGSDRPVGYLIVARHHDRPFDEPERAVLTAVASIASQAVDRAALFEAETRARHRAEILGEHANRLAAAILPRDVAIVTATTVYDALLPDGHGIARRDGDTVLLYFVDGIGDALERKWQRSPLSLDTPLHEAIRTGRITELHGHEGRARRYSAEVVAAMSSFESLIYWPLPNGTGAIGVGFTNERRLPDLDRHLLGAIAAQHAEALQRAVLHEQVRRRSVQTEAMQELATMLAAATAPEQMANVIVGHAHRTLGAGYAQLGLVDRQRQVIVMYHGQGLNDLARDAWPSAPLDAPIPLVAAVAQRRPVVLNTRDQLAAEFPAVLAASEMSGFESVATVPIISPSDEIVVGTLSLAWEPAYSATPDMVDAIEDIARRLAGALDRAAHSQRLARLAEQEHETATRLQRALLPARFAIHQKIQFAARYVPSDEGLLVGGDWYETVALPDGRLAIAVGDIVGHGLEAAATMGQMRTAFAALAARCATPADLLTQLDRFAHTADAKMSTMAIAYLDPITGDLRHVSAGHPPILHVPAEGDAHYLDGGRSWPLAIDTAKPRPSEAHTVLTPGDMLVAYTDGLIERRGESLDHGLERLRHLGNTNRRSNPDHLCDALLVALVDQLPPQDDVIVLVARLGSSKV